MGSYQGGELGDAVQTVRVDALPVVGRTMVVGVRIREEVQDRDPFDVKGGVV